MERPTTKMYDKFGRAPRVELFVLTQLASAATGAAKRVRARRPGG
jgi:hypothetical protein